MAYQPLWVKKPNPVIYIYIYTHTHTYIYIYHTIELPIRTLLGKQEINEPLVPSIQYFNQCCRLNSYYIYIYIYIYDGL